MKTIQSSALLNPLHPDYPAGLKQLNPLPVLYTNGKSLDPLKPLISIIGTSNPSSYGVKNTMAFSKALIDHGFCISSGIQEGVGSIALHSALRTGYTGICLGFCHSGIQQASSSKYRPLLMGLDQQGCLLSEYSDEVIADPKYIEQTARLIASICQAILVIESDMSPRQLSIVRWGLELGKDIFAIPGPISDPRYSGNHYLIKNGAKLIENPQDIFDEFN
jgi:DNA processing protein